MKMKTAVFVHILEQYYEGIYRDQGYIDLDYEPGDFLAPEILPIWVYLRDSRVIESSLLKQMNRVQAVEGESVAEVEREMAACRTLISKHLQKMHKH